MLMNLNPIVTCHKRLNAGDILRKFERKISKIAIILIIELGPLLE